MAKPLPTTGELLSILTETPVQIARLADGLSPDQLRTAPAENEWSANDVLAHLRSCADVWGAGIKRMLAEDHPTIRAISPVTWAEQTGYRELEFGPSLRAFTEQRAALLALLEPLPPEGWLRGATVRGAGRPLERSVHIYADRLALHERPHIKQISRIARVLRAQHAG